MRIQFRNAWGSLFRGYAAAEPDDSHLHMVIVSASQGPGCNIAHMTAVYCNQYLRETQLAAGQHILEKIISPTGCEDDSFLRRLAARCRPRSQNRRLRMCRSRPARQCGKGW